MGDNNDSFGIVLHIAFQPFDGLQIQVVGRLIQQQDIRFGQQQPDKRDPGLLSAGKLPDPPFQVFRPEPETGKHRPHFRIPVIAVKRLEFLLRFGIPVQQFFADLTLHLRFHLLHLPLQRKNRRKHLHQFLFHRAAIVLQHFLGQIADRGAVDHGHIAAVKGIFTAHAAQKSRLAAAIAADDGYLFI